MNQIISAERNYPFNFFTEKAFHRGQVLNMIADLYMEFYEYEPDAAPPSFGRLASAGLYYYQLGAFARISKLGEDYNSPFFAEGFSEHVRLLVNKFEDDIIRALEYFNEQSTMFSIDIEWQNMYKGDIATALELNHIFYVNSEVTYDMLHWFEFEKTGHPFAKENVDRLLRNVPFVRVW